MEALNIHQEIQNGILLYEYQYYLQDDIKIKHGFYKIYYSNGRLKETKEYKNNKCDGLNVKYYETGQKLYEIEYVEDIENGLTKYYYPNGNLQMFVNRVNGAYEGTLNKYFENKANVIKTKQDFALGELHGDYIEYDENENILFHHKYEKGILIQIIV
jgi:antitoxin component YwqK of YwqJK toxin-antitoxin module